MTGRWTYRVSAAGVLVLAGAAFTLSYDALHQLALDSQVRPALPGCGRWSSTAPSWSPC